jgi:hypothetical protein
MVSVACYLTAVSFRVACLVLVAIVAGCGNRSGDRRSAVFPAARDVGPGLECAAPWTFDPERGCTDRDANANLVVTHHDRMGDTFVLESGAYALDGRPFARFDAPADDTPGEKQFDVGRLRVSARSHTFAVHLVYRGRGYGVFSYINGYRFQVRSATDVSVTRPLQIVIDAHERGGVTTPLEERPAVSFLTGSLGVAAE